MTHLSLRVKSSKTDENIFRWHLQICCYLVTFCFLFFFFFSFFLFLTIFCDKLLWQIFWYKFILLLAMIAIKSNNLQFDTLGCLVDGANDSLTKHLITQLVWRLFLFKYIWMRSQGSDFFFQIKLLGFSARFAKIWNRGQLFQW